MTELNLIQLLHLVEIILEEQPERPIPLIHRTTGEPFTFWLSGIEDGAPVNSEQQSLDNLIGTLELLPWHLERDFSGDLIVYLCGNSARLEQNISQLFELAHGLRPGFALKARLLGQFEGTEQYACLLHLTGLQSYMPIVKWQNDPQCVIYCRYLSAGPYESDGLFPDEYQADDKRIGGIYVEWGYELPRSFSGFHNYYQFKNSLMLLGQDSSKRYIFPDAQFFPLLDLFNLSVEAASHVTTVSPLPSDVAPNLQINIGPLRDAATQAPRPPSSSSLFKFNMTLRSRYDTLEHFEADEDTLQEQIEYLQLQLEKVRLDKETVRPSTSSVYVYEELLDHPYADGLNHLRQFIARQPDWYLAYFEYQRLELELNSNRRVFHLVRHHVNNAQQNPNGFNPPASNYRFYREHQWSDVIGCDIYLPMDNVGRPMEFYPALLPSSQEMAKKFKPALLGENDQPGSTLLLWPEPWPDGQTIKLMLRVLIPTWENLRQAQRFINIRAIKEAVQTIPQPDDPVQLVRDTLFAGPLTSDKAEQQAIQEVKTAWNLKRKEIAGFMSKAQQALKQAAEAQEQKDKVEYLLKQIDQLHQQKQKDWANFVASVEKMNEEIINYPKVVGRPFETILSGVSQQYKNGEKQLEKLIADFKLLAGSNREYKAQVAKRLRRLANDLSASDRPEIDSGRRR